MAIDEKEQAILRWAVQNGKTKEEATQALVRYRTTGSPADPSKPVATPQKQDFLSETGTDVMETVSAVGSQFGKAGEDIVKTATDTKLNPLEKFIQGTAQAFRGGARAFGETVIGAGKAVLPQEAEEAIGKTVGDIGTSVAQDANVQKLISNYNALDPETKRNVDNALGFAEGLAEIVTGGAASRIARPVVNAITVTAQNVGKRLSSMAQSTVSELGGIAEKGSAGIAKAQGSMLDPASIMQRVARISKGKQADFQKKAKESVGQYLVARGIFGDIDEITTQLHQRFIKSRETADNAFAKLDERTNGATYKTEPVGTALDELFAREQRVSSAGARSRDFNRIAELKRKFQTQGLTHTEINEVKRLYERNVKVDYLKENKPEAVARATNVDSAIRNWQRAEAEKLGLTNLAEINRETMLAKELVDDLGREHFGQQGNNAITLTDWILVSNLDPTSISGLLVKKGLSDKGIQSAIAKKLAGNPEQPDIYPVFENAGDIVDSYGEWIKRMDSQTSPPKVQGAIPKTTAPVANQAQDLSTKLLEKLKGRTTVSKQFIEDLSNSPDLKRGERDLIRRVLGEGEGETFYRGEGGTDVAQGKALLANGRHFAMDSEYPKRFGEVKAYTAKPDAKVFDASGLDFPEIRAKLRLPKSNYLSPTEYTKALKENGYDILKYDGTYQSTGKPFVHTVEITEGSLIPKSDQISVPDFANKVEKLAKEMGL